VKQLATFWKAELLLLRVIDPLSFTALADGDRVEWAAAATREAEIYLQEQARQFDSCARVRTLCRRGPTSDVICDTARHFDLIAFAPRGHGGALRWIFGSVAEHVLRDAPCPVLLVRGETNVRFHHLLLPMDTSDAALEVCRRSQGFVPAGIRVTLLHCHGDGHLDERWCKILEREVDGKDRWQLVCRPEKAAEGITDWAERSDCDLIAMATRGRKGWEHFWKGSITERVSREAPCPVLVFSPGSLECRRGMAEVESSAEG